MTSRQATAFYYLLVDRYPSAKLSALRPSLLFAFIPCVLPLGTLFAFRPFVSFTPASSDDSLSEALFGEPFTSVFRSHLRMTTVRQDAVPRALSISI